MCIRDSLCSFRPTTTDATRDLVLWGSLGASLLTSYGRRALAKELLQRAEAVMTKWPHLHDENDLRGALRMGQSDYIRAFESDPWQMCIRDRINVWKSTVQLRRWLEHVHPDDIPWRLRIKRRLAGQHLKNHHTQCVDIRSVVDILDASTPVSYTHLDVYKRQPQICVVRPD